MREADQGSADNATQMRSWIEQTCHSTCTQRPQSFSAHTQRNATTPRHTAPHRTVHARAYSQRKRKAESQQHDDAGPAMARSLGGLKLKISFSAVSEHHTRLVSHLNTRHLQRSGCRLAHHRTSNCIQQPSRSTCARILLIRCGAWAVCSSRRHLPSCSCCALDHPRHLPSHFSEGKRPLVGHSASPALGMPLKQHLANLCGC
jgi:hypothetical protein